MIRRLIATITSMLIGSVLFPQLAVAQQQTVFIHGLSSDADTWEDAARRLSETLAISPKLPGLDSRARLDDQAASLDQNPDLNGNNLAIGHSNGGLVARRWARTRYLDGIVTIGTPHRGVPLLSNLGQYASYTSSAVSSLLGAGGGITYLAQTRTERSVVCCDWWWLARQVLEANSVTTGLMNYGFYGVVAALGLEVYVPVLGQMDPASGFMQELNQPDNLAWEASALPTRVGIVSSAPFWGGPFRAFAPAQADWIGWTIKGGAWTLYFVASQVLVGADAGDWEAWDVAARLSAAANYLDSLDEVWCAAVSSVGMQYCDYNDSVVPVRSQFYPGAVNIFTGAEAGPVHIHETTGSDPWLTEALTRYAHVARRTDPGEGGATVLRSGQSLGVGQSAASPNRRLVLTYQPDANLVLYDNGAAIWAIDCWPQCAEGAEPGMAVMQEDGNFVIRDAAGTPVWHTSSWANPGAYLAIQDDGNLVVYGPDGSVLWRR